LLIFLSQAFFPSLPFIFLRFSSPVASTHPLMTDFSFWISQIQLYMPKVHAQFMTFLIRFLISFLIVTCYLLTFLLIIFFIVQAFLFDVLQSFWLIVCSIFVNQRHTLFCIIGVAIWLILTMLIVTCFLHQFSLFASISVQELFCCSQHYR